MERNLGGDAQNKCAYHLTLYGKVQGVGFRRKLRLSARELDVVGWVLNSQLGHVEAVLQGQENNVQKIIALIYSGRYGVTIDDSVICKIDLADIQDFVIVKRVDASEQLRVNSKQIKLLDRELHLIGRSAVQIAKEAETKRGMPDILINLPRRYWREPMKKTGLGSLIRANSSSFTSEMWSHRIYSSSLNKATYTPEEILDPKLSGQAFMQSLGFEVPSVHEANVKFTDIKPRGGVVLKPCKGAGSNGVYLIYSPDRIYDMKKKKFLSSWDDLTHAAQAFLSASGKPDEWILEDIVLNSDCSAPHDLKFYSFYGSIPVVLEVARRPDGVKYCWWNGDLNVIHTGKYKDAVLESTPFDPSHLGIVKNLSLEIPSPFMRIDFYRKDNGIVFGEFTPQPGDFQGFNNETDSFLGREYAAARGRLVADLRNGKTFSKFKEFASSLEQVAKFGSSLSNTNRKPLLLK